MRCVGGLEKKAFSFGATPEGYCSHKCFFFLWSTYGTHRELFGRNGLDWILRLCTVLKAVKKKRTERRSARSHVDRVRPRRMLQQSQTLFQHSSPRYLLLSTPLSKRANKLSAKKWILFAEANNSLSHTPAYQSFHVITFQRYGKYHCNIIIKSLQQGVYVEINPIVKQIGFDLRL